MLYLEPFSSYCSVNMQTYIEEREIEAHVLSHHLCFHVSFVISPPPDQVNN